MSSRKKTTKFETPMKKVYMALPKAQADLSRKRIIEICGVNHTIFFNWMNGITPVPKLCRCVISIELRQNESDLFPE
jgi:hypothetical protein